MVQAEGMGFSLYGVCLQSRRYTSYNQVIGYSFLEAILLFSVGV